MIEVGVARGRWLLLAVSVLLAVAWGVRRCEATVAFLRGDGSEFTVALGLMFVYFAWQLWLAWRERPREVPRFWRHVVDGLTVAVNVPVFNEDPVLLERVVLSVFAQTRLPDRVEVVDDGSRVEYELVRARLEARVPAGVEFRWVRTENRGKRHAQMETFGGATEDILVTMDSDTILSPVALAEGLKPFYDPDVTAVAGLVLALNKHENLMTRVEDLVTSTWQLTIRSAQSMLGCVTVNSGPFALYRSQVVARARGGYLHETICGRPMQFSDDSLLTLYAAVAGRTVQQPSAVAFSAWPETFGHHVRQQVRWARGTFIRSLWRFRYLPLRSPALWMQVAGWATFFASSAMLVVVLLDDRGVVVPTAVVSLLLSYATTVRVLTVRRSDETRRMRVAVYLLSPLVVVWAWGVYRPLRVYGMVTCLRTGWGTRQAVEVTVEEPVGALAA